ncbi:SDR family NAD(P)-dependent oxidoreductase [Roseibium sp. M-1]
MALFLSNSGFGQTGMRFLRSAADFSRKNQNKERFMHVAITGATSGLGWEIARHYAKNGCSLLLSGRDDERLKEISKVCRDLGAEVSARKIDITDAPAVDAWLTQADAEKPIDLLIANAGIGGVDVVVAEHGETAELARRIVEINTTGTMNTVIPLIPRMTRRKQGHIVIVSSISAEIGLPQSPVYCASKAALSIYADAIRRLLKPHGVGVTCVLPGFVDTPMSRSLDLARPWCWPAEKAARRIARDVGKGNAHSIFPWQLRYLIGLEKILPTGLSDLLLQSVAKNAGPGNR